MQQLGVSSGASWYAPCPKCQGTNATPVGVTWWGGALGAKLLNHVECTVCGKKYNGKTGKSNSLAIGIYIGVATMLFIAAALMMKVGFSGF